MWSEWRLKILLPAGMCIDVLCPGTNPAPSVGIEQPIACGHAKTILLPSIYDTSPSLSTYRLSVSQNSCRKLLLDSREKAMNNRAVLPAQKLMACPAIYPPQIFSHNLHLRESVPKSIFLYIKTLYIILISIQCSSKCKPCCRGRCHIALQ